MKYGNIIANVGFDKPLQFKSLSLENMCNLIKSGERLCKGKFGDSMPMTISRSS